MKVAVLGAGANGGIMAIGLGLEYIQEELAAVGSRASPGTLKER